MTEPTPLFQSGNPPVVADERPMLDAWLDLHRDILLWKCQGVSAEDLVRRTVEPSSMSLIGLVRHMAEVERSWFRRVLAGEDDAPLIYDYTNSDDTDFDDVDAARVEEDFAIYRAEVARCRAVSAGYDLDAMGTSRRGNQISLRWIYVHMIEEYARHNGHADLIRERIDGQTGDWPDDI
ncbi:MAG TPA: DinB family protein [Nocardioidaceae bacterium]|nr:DinB family protein [Nocardioidaceae bacterium]